ncbi:MULTISPECIES: transglutaminase family protein [Burkholderia]|uniref:transglutaminase family protein n=1 Tax=Burkholderia TaxID=32008 RepID=UPI0015882D5A|nr:MULTISPECIES: transglutaminase family protein [Burkholderia]
MRLEIVHSARYSYDGPVPHMLQRLRLRPPTSRSQTVLSWEVLANDRPPELSYVDGFENHVDLTSSIADATEIVIVSRGEVTTHEKMCMLDHPEGYTPPWLLLRESPLTRSGNSLKELAAALKGRTDRLLQLHELMAIVHDRLAYASNTADTVTDAESAWMSGRGSCQDYAHVFITIARRLGIPARVISGYVLADDYETRPASRTWASAYVNDLGWVGFDPVDNICPNERYVKLAAGVDARGVAPVTIHRSTACRETLAVEIAMRRMDE